MNRLILTTSALVFGLAINPKVAHAMQTGELVREDLDNQIVVCCNKTTFLEYEKWLDSADVNSSDCELPSGDIKQHVVPSFGTPPLTGNARKKLLSLKNSTPSEDSLYNFYSSVVDLEYLRTVLPLVKTNPIEQTKQSLNADSTSISQYHKASIRKICDLIETGDVCMNTQTVSRFITELQKKEWNGCNPEKRCANFLFLFSPDCTDYGNANEKSNYEKNICYTWDQFIKCSTTMLQLLDDHGQFIRSILLVDPLQFINFLKVCQNIAHNCDHKYMFEVMKSVNLNTFMQLFDGKMQKSLDGTHDDVDVFSKGIFKVFRCFQQNFCDTIPYIIDMLEDVSCLQNILLNPYITENKDLMHKVAGLASEVCKLKCHDLSCLMIHFIGHVSNILGEQRIIFGLENLHMIFRSIEENTMSFRNLTARMTALIMHGIPLAQFLEDSANAKSSTRESFYWNFLENRWFVPKFLGFLKYISEDEKKIAFSEKLLMLCVSNWSLEESQHIEDNKKILDNAGERLQAFFICHKLALQFIDIFGEDRAFGIVKQLLERMCFGNNKNNEYAMEQFCRSIEDIVKSSIKGFENTEDIVECGSQIVKQTAYPKFLMK